MMRGKAAFSIALLLAASGCTTIHDTSSDINKAILGSGVDEKALIPDRTIAISSTVSYPLEKVVYWGLWIGVAYLILDPLAPNWTIEEARLDPQLVHFDLKMKRYYAGGAGEARQVFSRRAKALVRAGDFATYQVLEYNESLDSSVLGAQRRAEGVIRLIPKS
jgi:hypothetical protein